MGQAAQGACQRLQTVQTGQGQCRPAEGAPATPKPSSRAAQRSLDITDARSSPPSACCPSHRHSPPNHPSLPFLLRYSTDGTPQTQPPPVLTVGVTNAKVEAERPSGQPGHALLHLLDVLLTPVAAREELGACSTRVAVRGRRGWCVRVEREWFQIVCLWGIGESAFACDILHPRPTAYPR